MSQFLINPYVFAVSGATQEAVAAWFLWTLFYDSVDSQQACIAPGLLYDAS